MTENQNAIDREEKEQTVEISISSLYELKKSAERELTVKSEEDWVGETRNDLQKALFEANSVTREIYAGNHVE